MLYPPFRALAPALMLVLPLLEPVPGPPALVPGEVAERELSGGETQAFRLEARPEQRLLVTAEQHGVNVVLTCQDSSGKTLGTMDTATEREGTETWLIPAGAGGTYRLEVRPVEVFAPRGRYRIRVESLASATPEDLRRLEAERLMTEAGLLFGQEAETPRRQALELYRQALVHWQGLGRPREQARTLFRLAVVHQGLGEWQPMLERLQEALPLFAALGDRGRESDVLTYMGFAEARLGRIEDAIASYQRSLVIRRARGDLWGEAVTSQNLCETRLHLGERREAIPCYEAVIPFLERVGDHGSLADALNSLGDVYRTLGEPRKAREHFNRALEKKRALGDRRGEAYILNSLAVLASSQGALGEALGQYGKVLEVVRQLGDRDAEGRALANLGGVYLVLGEPGRAREYLEQALPMRRAGQDRRGEVNTLCNLGLAREQLGEIPEALSSYEEALKIAREAGYRQGEASSLNLLGQGQVKAGNPARALELFAEAAALQQALGNRSGVALSLQRTGEAEAHLNRREKALISLREAVDLYRVLEDRSGQAGSLASLAAVERDMGRLDEALAHAEEAIDLIESVRAAVGDPSLRASFLASQRLAFELAIGLRMALERKQPGRGHVESALALSERARARSLLDLLHEAGTDVRKGMEPELRERKETLAYRFGLNAQMQRGAKSDEQRAELQRELAELLAEADRLEDEIRQRNPRYAGLSQPLDASGIRGLLDPGTLLLEYSLGEEESYLWMVTPERVEGFELASRSAIQAVAKQVYEGVIDTRVPEAEAQRDLSRLLLAPVADRLADKRLVIVADGALQYIPFGVLQDPGDPSGSAPLVAGHEIVSLPSASVLDVQRRALSGRTRAAKAVAILADPVFTPWDSRLPKRPQQDAAAPKVSGMPRLQRLPATGREADEIAALLSSDQVFTARGVRASRRTALSGILAGYRVVHFATHGFIDSKTPRLSLLALSLYDDQGRPQEGLLGLSDVHNLELGADLVVLSGCETGLGREVRGEGLVGLTQGFFSAGAERVMASLWRVEDRATAQLMHRFYQAMLKEGHPPAAALRSAQLAIRKDLRWQDPFYWAPFVLQGDWR